LVKILTGDELPDKYIHLRKQRAEIHKILVETHKEYTAEFAKR